MNQVKHYESYENKQVSRPHPHSHPMQPVHHFLGWQFELVNDQIFLSLIYLKTMLAK